jgi:hypothetical protein
VVAAVSETKHFCDSLRAESAWRFTFFLGDQPTANNQQPTTNSQQTTTNSQQTTNNKQQPSDHQCECYAFHL